MTKFKYIFTLILAVIVIASCEREDNFTVEEQQQVNEMIGSWDVKAHIEDQVVFDSINVIVTKALGDSITIKDSVNNFWSFQVKAASDVANNAFQTDLSSNENSELNIGVKIANGKIIDKDSIYLEIQFEDDVTPFGNTYVLKGRRAS